uniref:Ribosomal protein S18 n=1 Tax=Romanomermis culicivorax TaxID=13658 RepID=A0A915L3Z8_ROMCU
MYQFLQSFSDSKKYKDEGMRRKKRVKINKKIKERKRSLSPKRPFPKRQRLNKFEHRNLYRVQAPKTTKKACFKQI